MIGLNPFKTFYNKMSLQILKDSLESLADNVAEKESNDEDTGKDYNSGNIRQILMYVRKRIKELKEKEN